MKITLTKEHNAKFKFGKIDYYSTGRKINAVEVDFGLREYSNGSVSFTASCKVWNHIHTDIIAEGQMLDANELLEIEAKSKLFKTIKELWQKYHLNNLHAGTPEQEEALRAAYQKCRESGNFDVLSYSYDFTQACEYLKSIGLYEVEYEGKPYRYGSGWINYPIPKDDLDKIYLILNTPQAELEKMF